MNILKKKIKEYLINIIYKIPNEKLYGKKYRNMYNYIDEFYKLSIEEKREIQLKKLQNIVKYAYFKVPYYKELFDKNNISYKIEKFEDFEKIPYLTKDIIRKNLEKLKSKENIKCTKVTTGGTTGIPMEFYLDKEVNLQENCFVDYYWKKYSPSYRSNSKIAVLRENKPKGNTKFQKLGNKLIMSSFKLTKETVDEYIKKLVEFSPEYIHCFPSSLNILAEYLLNKKMKINLKSLKGIFTSSETLYDHQKKNIENAFNTKICDLYGHSEKSVIAFSNIENEHYILDLLYGYTEILSEENKNIILEKEKIGEIVVTGFWNKSVPILRYRTGDLAVTNQQYNSILKVYGRKTEYLVDKNGNKITFTCADEVFWEIKNQIEAYQYIQEKKGEIKLHLEVKIGEKINRNQLNLLIQKFYNLYSDINIKIFIVEKIDRTQRGKFKYLIQKIND